ncbi:MAG: protease inhibitor I42 family protein [Ignavibacteriaceae bacterium]|jgi:predicted secreted protein
MKKRWIFLTTLVLLTAIIRPQEKDSAFITGKITASAIWKPGMEMMHAIHDSCDKMSYRSFGDCFLEQMKKFNASPEAVEFTKLTNSEGFMRDFKETGKVDIAYAVFPFRANENQVCFLVNGSPNMINVDNYDYISKIKLEKNITYKQIKMKYSHVSIWPGDRSGTNYPAVRQLTGGGQQFIFNYRLQDGCHACKLIGFVNLGFDFNNDKKLLAVNVINILSLNESENDIKVQGEYSNPEEIIHIKAGKCFAIDLKSNATTGYEWQLSPPLNENIVNNAGKIYLPPGNAIPGAGGKEIWNFITNNSGTTVIIFNYLRPWEKDIKYARKAVFKISVE